MARKGKGVRTRQYNPGAYTLAQYTEAALQHTRGAHDAGGEIIHETPKENGKNSLPRFGDGAAPVAPTAAIRK